MWQDFLSFRKMVSMSLLKFLYIIVAVGITIGGAITLLRGGVWQGLIAIVIGNLIWRVVCELWILLFSIHKTLVSIEENLKK